MPMWKLRPELRLGSLPKIAEGKLPDGQFGNIETIKFMKQVARLRSGHPLIRKFALNILQDYQVPSNNYLDEARAIGDYVKKRVRYVRDPDDIEYLQDPLDLIQQMKNNEAQGDCDDMALLIASLLLSIGHQPSFGAVRYRNTTGPYNHIYVVDYERNGKGPKTRIALDAIMKDQPIGFEVKYASGDEFPI